MLNGQRYSFQKKRDIEGFSADVPYLPFVLSHHGRVANVTGLLDTGASVNVLPYGIGLDLGFSWDEQSMAIRLGGNLAKIEAKGILILATVGVFDPVRLAFAWAKADSVPLILGRTNFFTAFDVCFYGAESAFEIGSR